MRYFPLFADLENADVVVVGGGEQAAQKVRLLCKTAARITVISRSRSLSTTPMCSRMSVRKRSTGSGTAFAGLSTRSSVRSMAWFIRLKRISSLL